MKAKVKTLDEFLLVEIVRSEELVLIGADGDRVTVDTADLEALELTGLEMDILAAGTQAQVRLFRDYDRMSDLERFLDLSRSVGELADTLVDPPQSFVSTLGMLREIARDCIVWMTLLSGEGREGRRNGSST